MSVARKFKTRPNPPHLPITVRQVRRFDEDGYLLIPALFDSDFVNAVSAQIDQLIDIAATLEESTSISGTDFVLGGRSCEPLRIDRIVGAGGCAPVLGFLGKDKRLTDTVRLLLDALELEQIINQVHLKLPGDEVAFDWHQDSLHRRYGTPVWRDVLGNGSFVQTLVAIDKMTETNGPIKVIPGSHRSGHLAVDAERRLNPTLVDTKRARVLTMNPGDALFIGPFTIHGSSPNRTCQPRRLFINGFCAQGANRRIYPYLGKGQSV
ncbi:MAG: phytanoyl-CoA dioxygenase family protein [Myxococcota bacterium]|nr:phytanoyl-CoA dioxygenase family protein [Myxococcota bacterium]